MHLQAVVVEAMLQGVGGSDVNTTVQRSVCGGRRYDQEGTPQFHQSLSVVPAGLTPIRTRSDDFEAELAADGRARDALQQRDRQVGCPDQCR